MEMSFSPLSQQSGNIQYERVVIRGLYKSLTFFLDLL